jgi:hypothetical protein
MRPIQLVDLSLPIDEQTCKVGFYDSLKKKFVAVLLQINCNDYSCVVVLKECGFFKFLI